MMGPSEIEADGAEVDSWEDLADAPFAVDPVDAQHGVDEAEVIVEGDLGEYQQPRGLPQPVAPSREARRLHELTHLPYANWCPHCVSGRRNNSPHFRSRTGSDRDLPLLVLDYCFVRNDKDEQLAKVLVGKLYPCRKVFACVVDAKGTNEHAVRRMCDFIKESGLTKFVYKSDKESSIIALMDEAIRKSGRAGHHMPEDVPVLGVPENSAVGESQSNGRAERAVQTVEDLLRTHKLALESKVKARAPSDHAVLRWLVEHVADILTKYTINSTGQSPYEKLHGRKVKEKRVEFGERVFFFTPKKGRAKLDARWKLGVYLGHASNTNEVFIGLKNGNVVRARSITRVVEEARWCKTLVLGVIGTPSQMKHIEDGMLTDDEVEEQEAPHDYDPELVEPPENRPAKRPAPVDSDEAQSKLDEDELVRQARDDHVQHPFDQSTGPRRVRITVADLKKYGFTDGCPRCTNLAVENWKYKGGHNEECRARMYKHFKQEEDVKWVKWARGSVDLEGMQQRVHRSGPDRVTGSANSDLNRKLH